MRQKVKSKNLNYSFLRIDKEKNIQIFNDAGWHFNNVLNPDEISKKLSININDRPQNLSPTKYFQICDEYEKLSSLEIVYSGYFGNSWCFFCNSIFIV